MTSVMKNPLVVGSGAIALVGIGVYVYQLLFGLGITGMNNSTSWGLYLTCFMFFVGLSAGGLIVASSASIFGIKKYKAVALPAVILSLVCICCAGICVLVDLGGIQRIWRMFTGLNFLSPLAWDMIVITCYLVINLVYLYFMCSRKADPAKVAVVSRFALPVAILVHSVTAWIFGLEVAREAWHTAILAPIFVASALDSGLALLVLALRGLRARGVFETTDELLTSLAGLLCTCIAVDAYFIGCEILTTAYTGTEGGMAGNAIRCMGKYLYDKGIVKKDYMTIETAGGIKSLLIYTRNGKANTVSVGMGKADLDALSLPTTLPGATIINRPVEIAGGTYNITCASVGNPHCVVFCEDPSVLDLETLGPQFEHAKYFPDRINTEFVRIVNENTLRMRVYERGNGETVACGTGACAAVIAATENGFVEKGKDITVKLIGGDLVVNYTDHEVILTGDAVLVYEGVVEY